jgi:hypothetical protein
MRAKVMALIAVLVLAALPVAGQSGGAGGGEDGFLHQRLYATILVADPDWTAEALASWAEARGGYFLLRSTDIVVVRVSNEKITDLRARVEEAAEEVVDIAPEAVDLREDYLGVQSAIRSREEILRRNLDYIDRADVAGTLAIEKEITALLGEIEGLKGRLRRLDNDRRFAYAEVSMSFKEQTLPEDIPSSFAWINTVDFYRFVREVSP